MSRPAFVTNMEDPGYDIPEDDYYNPHPPQLDWWIIAAVVLFFIGIGILLYLLFTFKA